MPTSLRDLQSVSNEMSTGRKRREEQDRKEMDRQQNIIPHTCKWQQDILNGALQGGTNNFRTTSLCTVSASQDHCLLGFL